MGVGFIFQSCSRTHSDRLPGVDSPQCWGMVSLQLIISFRPFYTDAESLNKD